MASSSGSINIESIREALWVRVTVDDDTDGDAGWVVGNTDAGIGEGTGTVLLLSILRGVVDPGLSRGWGDGEGKEVRIWVAACVATESFGFCIINPGWIYKEF